MLPFHLISLSFLILLSFVNTQKTISNTKKTTSTTTSGRRDVRQNNNKSNTNKQQIESIFPKGSSFSSSLYPTRSIISNIIDRYINNDSDNYIDVDIYVDNTTALLKKWGYSSESHTLRTEDGYYLTLHRITPKYANSPPVLIQHGLGMASDSWVLRGREDMAIMMHEDGYDVWLGNIRGNYYSRKHDYMDVKGEPFWDFSWHEHGYYDVPAMIDYILTRSGYPSLSYVGHSMGTTMFYVMTSTRPEYNKKINLQISLAPVAYCSRIKSYQLVFKPFGDNIKTIGKALKKAKRFEILERRLANPLAIACEDPLLRSICYQVMFLIIGPDLYQMPDENIVTTIIAHFPSGTSLKTLLHYLQNIEKGDFKYYNYGYMENIRKYGDYFPPKYNLSQITAPVAIFYSENDYLSNHKDARLLAYQLPNLVGFYRVPFQQFNHLDYVFARDPRNLLYNSVMCLLNLYNNKVSRAPCNMPLNESNRRDLWKRQI